MLGPEHRRDRRPLPRRSRCARSSVIATGVSTRSCPRPREAAVRDQVGEGRKLLVFADSRQDAAFFAPYLERTHRRAMQRSLILGAGATPGPRRGAAVRGSGGAPCASAPRKRSSSTRRGAGTAIWHEVRTALLQELLAADRRQSLEGTGLLEIALVFPRQFRAPPRSPGSRPQRTGGRGPAAGCSSTPSGRGAALTTPEGVDIQDDVFAPRNREYGVRQCRIQGRRHRLAPRQGVEPSAGHRDQGAGARSGRPLSRWRFWQPPGTTCRTPTGIWTSVLVGYSDRRNGPLWRLSHERFEFRPAGGRPSSRPLRPMPAALVADGRGRLPDLRMRRHRRADRPARGAAQQPLRGAVPRHRADRHGGPGAHGPVDTGGRRGDPGQVHARRHQRAELLDDLRARRRRRRGGVGSAAQRPAVTRQLRAARRPRRPATQLRCIGGDATRSDGTTTSPTSPIRAG